MQDENARAADFWIYNDLATAHAEARRTNKRTGLQKGDIIIGMEGNPLRISSQHLNMHVKLNYKVGDKLPLTLLRKGERIHFDWPLTDRD